MRSGRSTGRRGGVAFLTVVCLSGIAVPAAHAQSSGEIKAQITRAEDQIEHLVDEKEQLEEDHLGALVELEQVKLDIVGSQARIVELEAQLGEVQSQVSAFALQTFVSGDQVSGIGTLLTGGGGNLTETVEREQYAKLALSAGESATDELDSTINDLEKERAKLAKQQTRAERLIQDLEAQTKAVEKKAEELEQYQQAMEVKYGEQLLAERRARDAQRARDAAAAISRAQAAAAGRSGTGGGGSSTPRGGGIRVEPPAAAAAAAPAGASRRRRPARRARSPRPAASSACLTGSPPRRPARPSTARG